MIPIELRLINFMSYKNMEEPLSFSSIHTAVLCGPNGHGKSSLLDAITWAIWGQARGVDKRGTGTEDLIHNKEPHMQVEFTFELEGQRYRAIRSRSRKGKTGITRLEFQVLDDSGPRALTGETINATQEIINKTLSMDYETFVNSAFIMQGRADNFMKKTANERKEILSEILGLSVYDELEELAREKRKGLNERLRLIDDRSASISQEIERLPQYKQELDEALIKLVEVRDEMKGIEKGLAKLREKKAIFDLKAAQLTELNVRHAQVKSDIASIDEQLKALEDNICQSRNLIGKKDEIESGYTKLVELRIKEEKLSNAGQKHSKLESRINSIQLSIQQARNELESNMKHLGERKAKLEKELTEKAMIETVLNTTKEKLVELERFEQELSLMRERYSDLQQKKAGLDTSVEALESKLADWEKQRNLLTDGDSCPLCKKPLAEHEKRSIHGDFDREIASLRAQIDAARSESVNVTRELESLKDTGKQLSEKIKGKGELQTQEGKFAEKLNLLREAAKEAQVIVMKIEEINLKLIQEAFVQEEHSELKRLSTTIKDTGYSADEHRKTREQIKELSNHEQLKANLENALSNIKMTEATVAALTTQRELKLKSLTADEAKIKDLASELTSLKDFGKDIADMEKQFSEKRKIEAIIVDQKSTAQVKIDNCSALAKQKGEFTKERREVAREVEIYDKLAFIFSKKGIQALIIENIVPEIEGEANDLLHRLTNNQMSLRFVTQKDQRTGGVVETLDLIITDGELGERKYELFSGGEAFRINFAIRIALSKLLARRAGARLETLVVDEGFGTQDEEGKERLIEAISAIQNDFKKIIVITHLEDLKEIFPARIEVEKKRGLGSIARII